MPNSSHADDRQRVLEQRRRSRDRLRVLGLLLILLFILALAFVRFGKTIPWGAR